MGVTRLRVAFRFSFALDITFKHSLRLSLVSLSCVSCVDLGTDKGAANLKAFIC